MNTKWIALGAAAVVLLATGGFVFLQSDREARENQFEPQIVNQEDYAKVVADIDSHLANLAPTPPVGERWQMLEAHFVPDTPYVYVIYTDTYNIFRDLIEIGARPDGYRLVATFEPEGSEGWRLTHGEDAAQGKQTVEVKFDN